MTQKAASTPDAQAQRGGFFARIVLFCRQVVAELKKVVWPTRDELWTYFAVVIVFVVALMIIIGLLDFGFSTLSEWVFA